jgi:hypothetical protein
VVKDWNAIPSGRVVHSGVDTQVKCAAHCQAQAFCTQWTWNYGHKPRYSCFTSSSLVWGGRSSDHITSGCRQSKVSGCGTRPRPPPPPSPHPGPLTPHWSVRGAPDAQKALCGFRMANSTETTVVYRGTRALGAYNHAAMIDFHGGNFMLTWKNSPLNEDSPGQRVLYSFSSDGKTWTRTDGTNVLFPGVNDSQSSTAFGKRAPLFGGPTVLLRGRRYASASPHQFALWPYPWSSSLTSTEPTNLLLLRHVNYTSGNHRPVLGPLFWASASIPPGFEMVSKREGILTSAQVDATTKRDLALLANYSKLPCATTNQGGNNFGDSATTKCEACIHGCGNTTKCERTHYVVPGGGDVILQRGHKHVFTFSRRASPTGEWTPDQPTNIPDVDANLNAGVLPNGRVFLTSNACPKNGEGHGRDPLVVSSSADGFSFDRSVAVMSCEALNQCGPRIPGGAKDSGPSYPQGVTVIAPKSIAGLYVVATNNKEDVVVVRVPFDGL